jgi:3-oxoacyl-[acyl-carrier protein] reductase
MRLKNKVAIVTGAAGGIGKAISTRFANEGAVVVLNGRHLDNITQVANEIMENGGRALAFNANVTNLLEVKGMVEKTVHEFGRIDILVNNAGIMANAPIENLDERDWDKVVNINLKGTFLCCQAVGNEMIKVSNGSIVNIASIAAHQPYPLGGAYSASKSGVVILTKQVAIEWAKYNIRANAISPGIIRTPINEFHHSHAETCAKREALIPLQRIGMPEDVANAAIFFASDESNYITGQVLLVDGGLSETVCQHIPKRPVEV